MWEEQRVEIRYRKRDGEVKRLLDPLGLVLKAGVWYLVALSGRTRSLRTFRVSRVLSVKSLDEDAMRPDDFDLAAHWAEAQDEFLGSWQTVPVRRPHARASALWMVRYVQDPTSAESRRSTRRPSPTPTAGSRLTLQFENHRDGRATSSCASGATSRCSSRRSCARRLVERAASMVARYASVPA